MIFGRWIVDKRFKNNGFKNAQKTQKPGSTRILNLRGYLEINLGKKESEIGKY